MRNLLKIAMFSALTLMSACSEKDDKKTEELVIQSGENTYEYNVEVADTKETLYQGLMGRNSLAQDSGLLMDVTIVPKDMRVALWMKDTLIPLDMLFMDENGVVFYIYENAEPYSIEPIYPPKRPRAVLEINAGQAKAYNLKQGDVVKNRLFGNFD